MMAFIRISILSSGFPSRTCFKFQVLNPVKSTSGNKKGPAMLGSNRTGPRGLNLNPFLFIQRVAAFPLVFRADER